MKRYPQKIALCVNCGFTMRAAVDMTGLGPPQDGDYSICAGCACLYVHDAGAWRRATIGDVADLPTERLEAVMSAITAAATAALLLRSGRQVKKETTH